LTVLADEAVLGKIEGVMADLGEKSELAVFNYVFAGLGFPGPGRYVAKFTLTEGSRTILTADYLFRLGNPNPEELYLRCAKCGVKYGCGIVAKGTPQTRGCESACPLCGHSNPVVQEALFHLPNPE
jgi:hypothetical protein